MECDRMKKKRLLSLTMAVALLFGSAAALPEGAGDDIFIVKASADSENDFIYTSYPDGTAEITGYKGTNTDAAIYPERTTTT